MKYTRWAFKNKNTGKILSYGEMDTTHNPYGLFEVMPVICMTREQARFEKLDYCLNDYKIVKVEVNVKEAA